MSVAGREHEHPWAKSTPFWWKTAPTIRENLIDALEELAPGRVLGVAPDEAAAVAWLQAHSNACDVVIIDLFLAGGSGLGVLQAARDLDSAMKLVVFSNYVTEDMSRGCKRLGAHEVFDKSRDVEELMAYCCQLSPRG